MSESFHPKFVDLVRNTTTTTGTGNIVLGAAVAGYTSFATAVLPGESFYYSVIGVDKPAEREVGRGTMQSDGTIRRDPISGTKTNFTSGMKTVALIAAADWFQTRATPSPVGQSDDLLINGWKTPKRIWLMDLGCGDVTWCDQPDPDGEQVDSVEYVRADQVTRSSQAERVEVSELAYHAEQLSTYIAQPSATEKQLASARYHNDKIRAALNSIYGVRP
jgi:hypothetical protein